MRYSFMKKDIITSFLITGLVYIVAYTLFPLLSLAGVLDEFNAGWISLILMILFGYFQMNCWPVSFLIVSEYFTNQENGGLIGFWTTSSSIGNILGYMLPAFFILTLHDPWQVPNLILIAILLLATVAVYFFVERSNKAKQQGYLPV
jgi:sugar phosphate permease